MVNVGFIAEGDSEKILLSSEQFRTFLAELNMELVNDGVINVIGKNHIYNPNGDFTNIKPKVDSWIKILISKGAERIFFLLDLENDDPCISTFKSKVYRRPQDIVIIAKQSLEAWYLSDITTIRSYLQNYLPIIEQPEAILDPFDYLKQLKIQYRGRGINDKKILTRDMIKLGFSIMRAAQHPACSSAQYFYQKLQQVSNSNPAAL